MKKMLYIVDATFIYSIYDIARYANIYAIQYMQLYMQKIVKMQCYI